MPARIGSRNVSYSNNADIWQYQVAPTAGYAHTPEITVWTGGPSTAFWNWGDGSTSSGLTMSHTYTNAGIYTVTVFMPNINWWMKTIDIHADRVSGDFFSTLLPMTRLTGITTWGTSISPNCSAFNINHWPNLAILYSFQCSFFGDLTHWIPPTTMTTLSVSGSTLTGDITHWFTLPQAIEITVPPTVSADLSNWTIPAGFRFLYANSSGASGCPIFTSATSLQELNYSNCNLSQATVDEILRRMYERRISLNYSSKSANLSGSNATPSGVYQNATPPTTGLEYKYKLQVDPDNECAVHWTITTS